MKQYALWGTILVLLALLGFTAYRSEPTFGVALPSATALFETSLQSRISSTDTTMTLVANSVRGGGSISGYNCFTIDEGLSSSEFVCGTVSGTSVTGMQRGISPANGTSTVASLQYAHRAGADVKISDFPLLERVRSILNGSTTLSSKLSYASEPAFSAGTDIIDKTYADSLTFAGAPNASITAKGIVEIATALEAGSSTAIGGSGATLVIPASVATDTPQSCTSVGCVVVTRVGGKIAQAFLDIFTTANTWLGAQIFNAATTFNATTTFSGVSIGERNADALTASTTISATVPQAVFVATSTGAVLLSDASSVNTAFFDGFALTSAVNGSTVYVQRTGVVSGFSGLSKGSEYYVSASGGISTSAGASEAYVGKATSATQIAIDTSRSMQYIGSASMVAGSCNLTACSVSATVPSYARFIGVSASFSGNPASAAASGIMTRYGLSSITGAPTNSSGIPASCGVSGSIVSCSVGSPTQNSSWSGSGTAYFYR